MAKKQRRQDGEKQGKPSRETLLRPARELNGSQPAPGEGGSQLKARLLWLSAFILILCGYFFLTKADPGGRNSWSSLSPVFLLAGYLLIIPAISATYPD
jgi:hypothetical protein